MTLSGEENHDHRRWQNIGVLLANLGTPDAPTTPAVRRYLRQFLGDERVVEMSTWRRQILLNGIIVPRRAPHTAAAYRRVWTKNGSPLMVISRAQQKLLADSFAALPVAVELAMRYGNPSLADGLQKLRQQNCRRIVVLPLYPQYASSTTGSVFAEVCRVLSGWRAVPHFRYIGGYCDDPRYVAVLADSIRAHRRQNGAPQLLLFSFHGMPIKMLRAGDPYYCLCQKTARLTAQALELDDSEWTVSFQSRFGKSAWLNPYTDETLAALPERGIKHVQVVCPAFAADCLETLEEIALEGKHVFLAGGGNTFSYIPALNDSPPHIDFLRQLTMDNIADWLKVLDAENSEQHRAEQHARMEKSPLKK